MILYVIKIIGNYGKRVPYTLGPLEKLFQVEEPSNKNCNWVSVSMNIEFTGTLVGFVSEDNPVITLPEWYARVMLFEPPQIHLLS